MRERKSERLKRERKEEVEKTSRSFLPWSLKFQAFFCARASSENPPFPQWEVPSTSNWTVPAPEQRYRVRRTLFSALLLVVNASNGETVGRADVAIGAKV
jgi:hypothetical protein